MAFLIQPDCHCCQKAGRAFDALIERYGKMNVILGKAQIPKEELLKAQFHCHDCWLKYHNHFINGKDDWLNYEEFIGAKQ